MTRAWNTIVHYCPLTPKVRGLPATCSLKRWTRNLATNFPSVGERLNQVAAYSMCMTRATSSPKRSDRGNDCRGLGQWGHYPTHQRQGSDRVQGWRCHLWINKRESVGYGLADSFLLWLQKLIYAQLSDVAIAVLPKTLRKQVAQYAHLLQSCYRNDASTLVYRHVVRYLRHCKRHVTFVSSRPSGEERRGNQPRISFHEYGGMAQERAYRFLEHSNQSTICCNFSHNICLLYTIVCQCYSIHLQTQINIPNCFMKWCLL